MSRHKAYFVRARFPYRNRENFESHLELTKGTLEINGDSLEKLAKEPNSGLGKRVTIRVKVGNRWRLRNGIVELSEQGVVLVRLPCFMNPKNIIGFVMYDSIQNFNPLAQRPLWTDLFRVIWN